uniref:Uncharacterized protein n=1 Tax=Oryza nivara TaxID=4536 RepID=A0A0E0HJB9_ORYNI
MRKAGRSVVEEKKSILGVGGRGSRLVLLVFEVVAGDEDAAVEALGAGAADPGEVGPDHEGEVAALVEVDAGGAFAGVPVVEVLLVAPASDGVGSPGVPAVPPDVEALGEAVAGGGADLAVAAPASPACYPTSSAAARSARAAGCGRPRTPAASPCTNPSHWSTTPTTPLVPMLMRRR